MPTLSIGIITRNRKDMLRRCLESIYSEIQGISMEVVVIDNNSYDETPEMIIKDFNNVVLVANKINMGVAKGRNQIIDRYLGKYLLIIDDDTKILSSNFEDLISYMEIHKNVGVIGCRILTPEKNVYPSARTFPMPKDIILRRLTFLPFFKHQLLPECYQHALVDHQAPKVVDFVMGAFQLIKRKAQERVGMLDGIMNYGFQDADFCARMIKAGFLTVYYPKFTIIHYQGVVSERMFSKYALYYIRSYVWFCCKHRELMKRFALLRKKANGNEC